MNKFSLYGRNRVLKLEPLEYKFLLRAQNLLSEQLTGHYSRFQESIEII